MSLELLSDTNSHQLVDKLRTIRPFTESQLLTLYNNNQLETIDKFVDQFVEVFNKISQKSQNNYQSLSNNRKTYETIPISYSNFWSN